MRTLSESCPSLKLPIFCSRIGSWSTKSLTESSKWQTKSTTTWWRLQISSGWKLKSQNGLNLLESQTKKSSRKSWSNIWWVSRIVSSDIQLWWLLCCKERVTTPCLKKFFCSTECPHKLSLVATVRDLILPRQQTSCVRSTARLELISTRWNSQRL